MLSKEGYQKRGADEIKQSLRERLSQIDPNFVQAPADIQNNLLNSSIPLIMELENLLAEVVNSFSPEFADRNGFMAKQYAHSLGLAYKDEAKAQVTLKFLGEAGLYVPQGTEVKGGFKTESSVTLDSSGIAYASAKSDTTQKFKAGEIDEVITNVSENLSVTNPSNSLAYQPVETDEELWKRSQRLLKSSRVGGLDYAMSLLTKIEGVSERLINFNFISDSLKRGIEVIVGGGKVEEVANALFNSFIPTSNLVSSPSGEESSRTSEFTINYYGNPLKIVWTQPKKLGLKINAKCNFKYVNVYAATIEEEAQIKFREELNSRKVGLPLNKMVLDSILQGIIQRQGISLQYLQSISYIMNDQDDQSLQFDGEGYLAQIKKDVYTELLSFSLEIRSE